jgi:hypothetical protein
MKAWLMVLLVVPLAGWFLIHPMRDKVMPAMVAGGTEQMLAQWRDGMKAFHADEGAFPIKPTGEDLTTPPRLEALGGQNKASKEYMDKTSVRHQFYLPLDGWGNPLVFDPENKGDASHVVSNGADGLPGTADDISSLTARQRNLEVPLDALDERTRRKTAAKAASVKEPATPTN